jgi:hypothetical protein
MREKMKLIAFAAVIALSIPLAACGGGGADVQSEVRTTTVGQELSDLKKAYESGAINQAEYEKQRQLILNRK